ncbi:MAG: carboxypeptidase regulatory-like domain-containing protein [Myxococcota bacterium]|nr:carboxypeptidase regulatory-like domain-containing protein [Myxococcota bacterium]
MNHRRDAWMIGLGIGIGATVTAVLFLSGRSGSDGPAKQSFSVAQPFDSDAAHSGPSDDPIPFTRDITGTGTLTGTVRDADGTLITSAIVRIHLTDQPWSHPDPLLTATTDRAGQFAFEGLSEALTYQVWAFAPERSVSSQRHARCGAPVELVLEDGSALTVSFIKPNGDPAGSTRLQIAGTDLWPNRQTKTQPDGAVTIAGLRAGEYVLWAHAPGFAHISADPIRIEQGDEWVSDIELEPAGTASITVINAQGNPVGENATVIVRPVGNALLARAFSPNLSGRAGIWGLVEGIYSATVVAKGYIQSSPIQFRPGDNVTVRLEQGVGVSGMVQTEDGIPIAGASVAVDQAFNNTMVALPFSRDRDFGHRLVRAAGRGWPLLQSIEPEPGRVLSGPHHMPLPLVDATQSTGGIETWQPTDATGRFAIDGLPPGRLSVSATHPDYVLHRAAELILAPQTAPSDIVVTMRPGTTLTVRAVDERGYPVRGTEIAVYDANGGLLRTTTVENDGYTTLKNLPKQYKIEARAQGRVAATRNVRSKPRSTMEMEITLPLADKTLHGRVLNENGFGISNVTVTARAISKGLAQALITTTEADGTFSLTGAGSGPYHLTAAGKDRGRAQTTNATHQEDIKLVLKTEPDRDSNLVQVAEVDEAPSAEHASTPYGTADNLGVVRTQKPTPGTWASTDVFGQADPLPVTGPPPGRGGLPITIGGSPGRVIVTGISPQSNVALTDLSKGDRIVAIDGKKVAGPAAARKALLGSIGSVVLLEIEGDDGRYTVVVQRVRISSSQ